MDIMLISMLPLLVPLAFVLYYALHRVKCPDCGDMLLFLFYSPFKKTRRLSRASCYLCARCGCETNLAGQKVTADMPPTPFPTFQWVLLAVGLLVGVGLGATVILGGRAAVVAQPAPVVIAAPPVIEPFHQAPAAAPVN